MNVNFNVKLSKGNSVGNYNIYFDEKIESNLATLKNGGGKATNISFDLLSTTGVEVTVPDTTKNIIVFGVTCENELKIPVNIVKPKSTPPNLCFTYQSNGNKSLNFAPSGMLNGKTKWIYGSTELYWNPFLTTPRWQVDIDNGNIVLTTTNISDVPNSGWYAIGKGATTIQNLNVAEGECPKIPLILALKKTDNSCFGSKTTDGVIVPTATGGSGTGYQYSIDGNKYSSFPTFNNLASGDFTVYVKDSENTITQQKITIGAGGQKTQHQITINKTQKDVSSDDKTKTVKTEWSLSINPSLPNGTSVKVELNVSDIQVVNTPGAAAITNNIEVFNNNVKINPLPDPTISENTVNRADCAAIKYVDDAVALTQTKQTDSVYEITINAGDVISGTVLSTINITSASNIKVCNTKVNTNVNIGATVVETVCNCCNSVGFDNNQVLTNSLESTSIIDLCGELKLTLTNYKTTYISALTVGELQSNNVVITDYYINWYKDGNNQQPAFTSGKGKKFFLQNLYQHTQPIIGNSAIPLEEGVYIPVVQKVTINDKEYDLSSYLNCLPSTTIVALGCDDVNQTERYAYTVDYDTITNTPQTVSTTFKLKSGVKYIPIWFKPQNIPDTLTVNLYNKTYGLSKPITLIKIKGGQSNTDRTQYNPFDGDIVTRLYDLYFILNLSKFTISDDDYLIFKVDPGGSKTQWFLKWKCLSDITCGECLFDDTINKKISKQTIVISHRSLYTNDWKDEELSCDTDLEILSVCDENLLSAEQFDYLYYNKNFFNQNNTRWSFKGNVMAGFAPVSYSPENNFKGCQSRTVNENTECKNGKLTLTRNPTSFTITSTQSNVLSDIFNGLQQKVTEALQQLKTDKTKPDAYGVLQFNFITNLNCPQGGGESTGTSLIQIQIPHKLFVSIGSNSINFTLPTEFTKEYVQDVYLQDLPKTCAACFNQVSAATYNALISLQGLTGTEEFTVYSVNLNFQMVLVEEGTNFTPPNFGILREFCKNLLDYQKTTVPYVINNNNRQILQEYVAENCKEVNQKLSSVGDYNFTFYNAQMINKNTFDIYRVPLINGRWNGFPNPPAALGERILTVQRIFNNNTFVNNGTYVFSNENPNYVTD